ncbi:MAG: hypothetical protein ABII79_05720 [bacterium]
MLDLKAYSQKVKLALRSRRTPSSDEALPVSEVVLPVRHRSGIGRHIAFCVDENSVHMAAVSRFGRRKKILDIGKVYVPSSMVGTSDQVNFIAETVGEFLKRFGRRSSRISVVVSGRETAFRTFSMPALKRRDLDAAVAFEVRKQVPFPPEDCIYDYRLSSKFTSNGQNRYKVGLHAATKRLINEVLQPFRQQNVCLRAIHHSQDVIGRLLPHLPDFDPFGHTIVVNITREHSEIAFYHGACLEFFQISPVGSLQLGSTGDIESFAAFARSMAAELQTSMDYYTGQFQHGSADRVLICGDLAYSSDLLELLNGYGNILFERFPAENLDFISGDNNRFTDTLPVCLAALASASYDTDVANLLPAEDRSQYQTRRVDRLSRVALILVTLALFGGWMLMKQEAVAKEESLLSLNRQVDRIKNSEAYGTYHVLKRQIVGYQAFLDKAHHEPSYLTLNLKELSLLTPSSVQLLDLVYDSEHSDHNLTVRGIIKSTSVPPEVLLAEFVESLKSSAFFDNVKLSKHVKSRFDDHFEIEFRIDMQGTVCTSG